MPRMREPRPENRKQKQKKKNTLLTTYSFQIDPTEIKIKRGKPFGTGSTGTVFEGRWNTRKVAVKELFYKVKSKEFKKFVVEYEKIMRLYLHVNLVEIYGITIRGDKAYLVMEFIDGASFRQMLQEPDFEYDKISFVEGIAAGMAYLHRNNIVHRNLTTKNIMVGENGIPKITDYGINANKKKNLAPWMAPEDDDSKYGKEGDVWSFGVTLWETVTQQSTPRKKMSLKEMPSPSGPITQLEIPEECDSLFSQLMRQCWDPDVETRPTFDQILESLSVPQEFGVEGPRSRQPITQKQETSEENSDTKRKEKKPSTRKKERKHRKEKKENLKVEEEKDLNEEEKDLNEKANKSPERQKKDTKHHKKRDDRLPSVDENPPKEKKQDRRYEKPDFKLQLSDSLSWTPSEDTKTKPEASEDTKTKPEANNRDKKKEVKSPPQEKATVNFKERDPDPKKKGSQTKKVTYNEEHLKKQGQDKAKVKAKETPKESKHQEEIPQVEPGKSYSEELEELRRLFEEHDTKKSNQITRASALEILEESLGMRDALQIVDQEWNHKEVITWEDFAALYKSFFVLSELEVKDPAPPSIQNVVFKIASQQLLEEGYKFIPQRLLIRSKRLSENSKGSH